MSKLSIVVFIFFTLAVIAQQSSTPQAIPPGDRPRVFITDSQSWEMSGGAGASGGALGGATSGGARPQTAEIIKTFGEKCPDVMVNNIQAKANYIVVLDHEGGKGYLRHRNKVAVFDAKSGDSVISKSTLSLGGSVEEACKGIVKHWADHKSSTPTTADPAQALQPVAATAAAAPESKPASAHLNISSNPDGADIEIDGNFVGNTPSSIQLDPGDHAVVVKRAGYKGWERKIKVSGGDINIKAELEK